MAEHSIIGDILGLLSAVSYGLFTGTLFMLTEVITPTISLNSVNLFLAHCYSLVEENFWKGGGRCRCAEGVRLHWLIYSSCNVVVR
jgi:hypothetical protein